MPLAAVAVILVGYPSMPKSTFRKIELNATWQALERVRHLTELVLTGKRSMQMFCSIPGMGKTEIVSRCMKKHGLTPHYSSPQNASALCRDLWTYRDSPYLLDDIDNLARSEPCANVMKMAFGAQKLVICPVTNIILKNEEYRHAPHPKYAPNIPETEEYRLQRHPKFNPNIPEPTFRLGPRARLIWSSNKNFADPNIIGKDMAADFAALVSRGLDPLWIPHEPQDLFDYTLYMVVEKGMLRGHPIGSDGSKGGFSTAIVDEVLRFWCEHASRLKEISLRAIWKLANSRRNDPGYEAAWQATLDPKAKWNIELPDEIPQVGSRKGAVTVPTNAPNSDDANDDPPKPQIEPEVIRFRQGST